MRLKLVIDTGSSCIPYEYHGFLQAAIYRALEEKKADFYHNVGYESHNRHYKMFVFSDLKGNYYSDGKGLYFKENAKWYISSLDPDFMNQLYIYFTFQGKIQIGKEVFDLVEVTPMVDEVRLKPSQEYWVQTLSPVTCYKTDEKKYTTYFDPKSSDFENSVRTNLEGKLLTVLPDTENEFFEILEVQRSKMRIVKYKQMNIHAYNVRMKIRCSDNYLKILMHTGMGSKNSAGFGMLKLEY
ncbi:MAG: CRISPR-associated endoribonuclease Cas6 [Bacillota bacterium]|nr:CRISPR-associated endoribonuclease Cas6 [Bacillota bacterium]